ncbi:MAG: F0F1 ATP synthase subunit B [Bacteroidales bacterium]|nr:F0F1 ATP synthase subunit B [Bacteroidales bacterium]
MSSLLKPEFGLLFWMFISFVFVFILLAKYGFPVITKAVNNRKEYIDEALKKAEEANERYDHLNETAEAIIEKANQEQIRLLNEATAQRDKIIEEARRKASVAANKEFDHAMRKIQAEKENAIRDIRKQVGLLSVEIAEKVVREKLKDEKEQMRMIDKMIDEVINAKVM